MSDLTVARIEIDNLKAVQHAELDLRGRNLIILKGANSAGKTSVLDAIKTLFAGGSTPELIRKGEKQAKVVLELSDGTILKKTQGFKGAQLSVMTAEGERIPSPQSFIDGLATGFAFNPLEFVAADRKARLAYLQKAMPLTFTAAELHGLKFGVLDAGEPLRGLVGPDAKLNLEEFDKIRATVYEKRRQANSAVTELDKTITNLRRSLPADEESAEGAEGRLTADSERLQRLDAAEKAELDLIARQVAEARQDAVNEYNKAVSEALRTRDTTLADIGQGEQEAITSVREKYDPQRGELQRAIGQSQSALKRSGEVEALRKHLEEQRDRLAQRSTEADNLSRTLDAMDSLKKSRTEALPIPGLHIENGEIFLNGIPFDHLNHARRYMLAIELGTLTTGSLGICIADEGEALDENEFNLFCEAAKESGLQVIMARVDNGPLRAEPQGALKL